MQVQGGRRPCEINAARSRCWTLLVHYIFRPSDSDSLAPRHLYDRNYLRKHCAELRSEVRGCTRVSSLMSGPIVTQFVSR